MQIAFTTRSGSNEFNNSIYHYFKHPILNSNYYFNKVNGLDKNQVIVHQYGGRSGGPIVIPELFDGRNKAFYFFNFEHLHQPSKATRTRTHPQPDAAALHLLLSRPRAARSRMDLLTLAAQNSQTATLDPTIATLLGRFRSASAAPASISTPPNATNAQSYVYRQRAAQSYAPTGRVDINLS